MPRKWTDPQKQARSEAVKLYWKEHGHPMVGRHHGDATKQAMKKRKQRTSVKGHCVVCGRALYNRESARLGLGPICGGRE
jgi:Fe-S cluster biogenesis protein NfuA